MLPLVQPVAVIVPDQIWSAWKHSQRIQSSPRSRKSLLKSVRLWSNCRTSVRPRRVVGFGKFARRLVLARKSATKRAFTAPSGFPTTRTISVCSRLCFREGRRVLTSCLLQYGLKPSFASEGKPTHSRFFAHGNSMLHCCFRIEVFSMGLTVQRRLVRLQNSWPGAEVEESSHPTAMLRGFWLARSRFYTFYCGLRV